MDQDIFALHREALLLDDRLRRLPIPADRLAGYRIARALWRSLRRVERRRRLLTLRVTHAAPTLALLQDNPDRWAVPATWPEQRQRVYEAWRRADRARRADRDDLTGRDQPW